jgi:DNA-binding MarR family transcriptional regulator
MSRDSTSKETAAKDSIDGFLERVLPLYPSLDPQTEAAVDRMTKVVKHLDRISGRTVAAFGLNVGEFKCLLKLHSNEHEEVSAGELADILDLSTGAMTNRLDGLEEAGYLARRRDTQDRRSVLVSITQAGREVLGAAVAAQGAEEKDLLASLAPAEREQLNALLRRVVLAIEDADAERISTPSARPRAPTARQQQRTARPAR